MKPPELCPECRHDVEVSGYVLLPKAWVMDGVAATVPGNLGVLVGTGEGGVGGVPTPGASICEPMDRRIILGVRYATGRLSRKGYQLAHRVGNILDILVTRNPMDFFMDNRVEPYLEEFYDMEGLR